VVMKILNLSYSLVMAVVNRLYSDFEVAYLHERDCPMGLKKCFEQ